MSTPAPLPGISADIVNTIVAALGHDPARVTKVEIERGVMAITTVHHHQLVEQTNTEPAPQSPEGTTDGGNEPATDGEQPEPAPARRPGGQRRVVDGRKKAGK